jgi:hypothetical protein
MGRLSYVCTTCSEHFTRKYSAKRHNNNLHRGAAEIVRLIDYIAGRSSGQYSPTLNPSWYKRRNIGPRTVADTVGETFQPLYIPQQRPRALSQYPTTPKYSPMQVMADQRSGHGLSQGTILKIEELRRLLNIYPQYQNNDPDEIVRLVIFYCINGDNTPLDDKLEQLRSIDSLTKY